MIKIKNLTLRNFLSVGNATQTINFNREELVLILGENLDIEGEGSGNRNGAGKCLHYNSIIKLKNSDTGLILEKRIGQFYAEQVFLSWNNVHNFDITPLYDKFTGVIDLNFWEIETDSGWKTATKILRTVPFEKWKIETKSGLILECADTHIVFDDNFDEMFVKDIILNKTNIQTINGSDLVIAIEKSDKKEEMFDISVDSMNHRYYSSGILSHNTTILNALSYSLFAWPLSNIKKEHLINKSNGKNMLVTIEFESNNKEYKIVRGLKPRILEFYENGNKKEDKDLLEVAIEDSAQGDNRETQKEIEKVLNMSHDMFCQIVTLNTYTTPFLFQKVSDQRQIIEQLLGITLLSEKADKLKDEIKIAKDDTSKEDIRIKGVQEANKRIQDQINSLIRRQKLWTNSKAEELTKLEKSIDFLSAINVDDEIKNHNLWDEYNTLLSNKEQLNQQKKHYETSLNKDKKILEKLEKDLASLETQCCNTCHQKLKDEQHKELMEKCQKEFIQVSLDIKNYNEKINELIVTLSGFTELEKPEGKKYATISEVYEHKNKLDLLLQNYEQKYNELDPYIEQIEEMQNTAIESIDFSNMNALTSFVEHQEFLLKLLVNKDSFIRKKIIEQNLTYLNLRLDYYLNALGLPHSVIFQNDLDVNITELGRELSPGNLSRGEMARLQLGLSLAFLDTWESLFQKINLLGLDEMIDSGIDASGSDSAIKLLKNLVRERGKDVWVISHKDELSSKCDSVLTVTKENGYTSFNFND